MAAPSSPSPPPLPPPPDDKPFLIFFDFDETLVDESSDDVVVRAAPGQRLPDWLKSSYRPGHYNEYMGRVLAHLGESGVTEADVRSVIEQIPASPGVPSLLRYLAGRAPDFEMVLVSDANTFFVDAWLRRAGARELFAEVFTNPAAFDRQGRLVLRPHHAHACPRCPQNMCKQAVVRQYLGRRARERGRPFQRVLYVGDGANDFCPSLVLGPRDTAFPRRDYPMHQLITQHALSAQRHGDQFRAAVVPWSTGEDVLDQLRRLVEE